jgi:hypothetical protein
LDCISVTSVPVAVILQAGVDVSEYLAYPTSLDADASTPEHLDLLTGLNTPTSTTLEYLLQDGQTLNVFEAFLFLSANGAPTEAYTVAPQMGPFLPWAASTAGGLPLPADPVKQLAFNVMDNILLYEHKPAQKRSGQQWWAAGQTAIQCAPFPGGGVPCR